MKKVLKQCLFAIVVAAVCLQVCYMCGLFTAEDFFGEYAGNLVGKLAD